MQSPISFQEALDFFKARREVVFISYNRFWEKVGFVQQSLAYALAKNGVNVLWVDGRTRDGNPPVIYPNVANLEVVRLFEPPFRRFAFLEKWSEVSSGKKIRKWIEARGNPVVWVQTGIQNEILDQLPYVDVLSTFDDPYYPLINRSCLEKPNLVLCQNQFTYDLYKEMVPQLENKLRVVYPPFDFKPERYLRSEVELPWKRGFKKVLGYIGGFRNEHYHLDLFENFMEAFPEHAFVLVGRTDAEGESYLKRFKEYSNFFYVPWDFREKLFPYWKSLDVLLLFYRATFNQNGAFPIKVLESSYFNLPILATRVRKTYDLKGKVFRSNSFFELKEYVEKNNFGIPNPFPYNEVHEWLDPEKHLIEVASHLNAKAESSSSLMAA